MRRSSAQICALQLAAIAALLTFTAPAFAADPVTSRDYPIFVSNLANPNDYSLFANGGWDGNWYVGYNTCWIKKLPAIPPGAYSRAYIGAKLGRAKLAPSAKNVWDKKPVPGSVYIALSSTLTWSKDQQYVLVENSEIPLEGDYESAVEGTGESQWFWQEIPLEKINAKGDNYLALGSTAAGLLTVSSSPVLAAGWGGKEADTWLLRDVEGAPPRTKPKDIGQPLAYFQPAMALKLIPESGKGPHPIQLRVTEWKNPATPQGKPTITVQAAGDSIQQVWLEYGSKGSWTKIGRTLWKAPYIFSLDQTKLPHGRLELRVCAKNVWEEQAVSIPFNIEVAVPKT